LDLANIRELRSTAGLSSDGLGCVPDGISGRAGGKLFPPEIEGVEIRKGLKLTTLRKAADALAVRREDCGTPA